MNKITIKKLLAILSTVLSSLFLLPDITLAQGGGVSDLQGLIALLIGLINSIIPLLFGIALVVFIIGVIRYVIAADPKKVEEGRNYIIYSIVGIAVMMSVWALASFLKNSFFPGVTGIPQFNVTSGTGNPGTGSISGDKSLNPNCFSLNPPAGC